jgi:putative mRNA 3-end processing factor
MRLRDARRQRGFDRGFALSDHVDWRDLLQTIAETGASRVLATHGETAVLVRYLREVEGLEADALATAFTGEAED